MTKDLKEKAADVARELESKHGEIHFVKASLSSLFELLVDKGILTEEEILLNGIKVMEEHQKILDDKQGD